MRKGEATRERILDIAEAAVLAKGFGATSIEEIIAEAGLTKSGFFYHFADKNALARAMMERYVVRNNAIFEAVFARADDLSDGDPLQSLLIGIKLLAEQLADLPSGHPGCLVASVVYQERLFDRALLQRQRRPCNSGTRSFALVSRQLPLNTKLLKASMPSSWHA